MYFSAIGFINDVKKGPFWEHSPVLYNVSGIKDGWGKINKGMIKMFLAEVLGKFPVVQHFPFGSMFSWEFRDDVPESVREGATKSTANVGGGGSAQAGAMPMVGTQAPWAQGVVGMGAFPRPGGVGMPASTQMHGTMPRPMGTQQPGMRAPATRMPGAIPRGPVSMPARPGAESERREQ